MEGFSGSRIGRVNPDCAKILALIEVSKLLLDGILGIPSIACLNHHSDQHGRVTRYIEAPGQTNHLILGTGGHLKARNNAKALEFLGDSDSITDVNAQKKIQDIHNSLQNHSTTSYQGSGSTDNILKVVETELKLESNNPISLRISNMASR